MWNLNPNPNMLVNCAHCKTPLALPPGAQSIRCAICQRVTHVAPAPVSPVPAHDRNPGTNPNPHPNPQLYAPHPPNANGNKKAVIVGVSYRYTQYELKGCLNDAKCMNYLLVNKFHFPQSSIVLLTEDQTDPVKLPTKHNIKMAMFWLIQGCQPGDSLFFHFSGHGSQQPNRDGGEVDGFDETILPMDFKTHGMLVDDEINMALVRPLPTGVRLHAVVDACHSGTVFDLPFFCRIQSNGQYVWEDHRPRNGIYKGTSGGEAYCFSGCDDNQTSADTSALSKVTYTGAMTFCFIQAIERGQARTYRDLLHSMRYGVQATGTGVSNGVSNYGGPLTNLVEMLLTGGSLSGGRVQEPQLTASNPFDISMPFTL